MNPILIIDDRTTPPKQRVITIYKRMLFEEMDAMSYRFSSVRPDTPSLEMFASATEKTIQDAPYDLTKERQVTIYLRNLYEALDAESRKFSEVRPDQPSHQSNASDAVSLPVTTKERTVTIYKQKLYEDIDAESYKFAEARLEKSPQQTNATASDTAERLDGHIIARLVENCDARLRKRMAQYLKKEGVVTDADNLMVLDASLTYTFVLSSEFPDTMLESLKNYIHRYIVWGSLADWYGASLGSEQANWFRSTLKDTEDAIVGLAARIDGLLAIRHLKFGDAKLRKRLMRFLKNSATVTSASDNITLDSTFVYDLVLPIDFNDSQMEALADHIHRYLVWSALYDWYGASLGSTQSGWFEKQLKSLGDSVVEMASRIDGLLAIRHLEYRDARLRRRLMRYLNDETEVTEANDLPVLDSTFVYDLLVPQEFKDTMVGPLKTHIHRYLLWGALFDWYGASLGSDQAGWFKKELDELESTITSMLSLPNVAKRPMQPFGPAQKIY